MRVRRPETITPEGKQPAPARTTIPISPSRTQARTLCNNWNTQANHKQNVEKLHTLTTQSSLTPKPTITTKLVPTHPYTSNTQNSYTDLSLPEISKLQIAASTKHRWRLESPYWLYSAFRRQYLTGEHRSRHRGRPIAPQVRCTVPTTPGSAQHHHGRTKTKLAPS